MKILFLPHCLKNFDCCDNKYTKDGLVCSGKHDCSVGRLKIYAEDRGYKVFIVPGGSLVEKLCKRFNPEFVVGVACEKEIKLAKEFLNGNYRSIKLLVDGCIGTKVDENKVREVLDVNQ